MMLPVNTQLARTASELATCQTQLERARAKAQTLEGEKADLENRLRHLEANLSLDKRAHRLLALERELQAERRDHDAARQRAEHAIEQLTQLEQDFDVAQEALAMHNNPAVIVEARFAVFCKQLQQQLSDMEVQLADAESRCTEMSGDVNRLTQMNGAFADAQEAMEEECASLHENRRLLNDALNEERTNLEEARRTSSELRHQLSATQQELQNTRARLDRSQEQVEAHDLWQSRALTAETAIAALREANVALESELEQARTELASSRSLATTLSEYKAELERCLTDHDHAVQQVATLENELRAVKLSHSTCEAAKVAATDRIAGMHSEICSLRSSADAATREAQHACDELQRLRMLHDTMRVDLSRRLRKLGSDLADRDRSLGELQQRYDVQVDLVASLKRINRHRSELMDMRPPPQHSTVVTI